MAKFGEENWLREGAFMQIQHEGLFVLISSNHMIYFSFEFAL